MHRARDAGEVVLKVETLIPTQKMVFRCSAVCGRSIQTNLNFRAQTSVVDFLAQAQPRSARSAVLCSILIFAVVLNLRP